MVPQNPCARAHPGDAEPPTRRIYIDLPPADDETELVIFIHRREIDTKIIRKKRASDPRGARPYLPKMN